VNFIAIENQAEEKKKKSERLDRWIGPSTVSKNKKKDPMGVGASRQTDEPVRMLNPDIPPTVTLRVHRFTLRLSTDVGIFCANAPTATNQRLHARRSHSRYSRYTRRNDAS
jgi:hypothetical protein